MTRHERLIDPVIKRGIQPADPYDDLGIWMYITDILCHAGVGPGSQRSRNYVGHWLRDNGYYKDRWRRWFVKFVRPSSSSTTSSTSDTNKNVASEPDMTARPVPQQTEFDLGDPNQLRFELNESATSVTSITSNTDLDEVLPKKPVPAWMRQISSS